MSDARPHLDGVRPLVLVSGLGPGGAEAVTAGFLRRLAERGAGVPVCTVTAAHDGPPARELAGAAVPRHDLGARRLADPAALWRLRRLLDRERIGLLHAHGQDATVLGALATIGRPAAFVATRHVLDEPAESWRGRLRARLALWAFRRADAAVAVSRAVADRLVEEGGVAPGRVRVIHNGVALERFAPSAVLEGPAPETVGAGAGVDADEAPGADGAEPRPAAREALALPPDAPVVLVPAVLRPGKGHETLIAALPRLRERVPGVRVLLAGDGRRRDALEREAARTGVAGAVRFLGHRDDVPRLLRAADVVALPSTRPEALPTALIEAAAAGRPAVGTRVGGTPEVVVHGETGLLVAPGDPDALADALAVLLEDAGRARRLGRAARRRAEERFDLARQIERTLALWREVAGARSGPEDARRGATEARGRAGGRS